MNRTMHKVCIYSISVAMTSLTIAFVLTHVLPPQSPSESAQDIANYYRSHTTGIRIGAVVGAIGAVFYAPFCAAIAWEVKRITGAEAAYVQIILGVIGTLGLVSPWTDFMTLAFRPERPAEILHAMYDDAWMPLYSVAGCFAVQFAFLGWAMLSDKDAKPTFPRWFAYFTVFTGLDQAFGVFVVFTKTGPFAWDGVIAYWIPLVVFGVWTNLMVKYMSDRLKRESAADAVASGTGAFVTASPGA